jgi:hypothetical protein
VVENLPGGGSEEAGESKPVRRTAHERRRRATLSLHGWTRRTGAVAGVAATRSTGRQGAFPVVTKRCALPILRRE